MKRKSVIWQYVRTSVAKKNLCHSLDNCKKQINPFFLNAPFLYPLETSKKLRFSDVFKGQGKGALGTNGLKIHPEFYLPYFL